MRPRVEEILEEVRARLDAAGFEHLPSQQIVLTGGGSQIPGLMGWRQDPWPAGAPWAPLARAWFAAGRDRPGFCLRVGCPVCSDTLRTNGGTLRFRGSLLRHGR